VLITLDTFLTNRYTHRNEKMFDSVALTCLT